MNPTDYSEIFLTILENTNVEGIVRNYKSFNSEFNCGLVSKVPPDGVHLVAKRVLYLTVSPSLFELRTRWLLFVSGTVHC